MRTLRVLGILFAAFGGVWALLVGVTVGAVILILGLVLLGLSTVV